MNVLQKELLQVAKDAEQKAGDPGGWKPDFHLVPPVGWLNDPNGLCRFRGEYHVFYQYSPFDPNGGLKFWGHYKSRDLLSWEQCPIMLCPDQAYDLHGVYSGSALCREDGMYLYYTGNVKQEGPHDYISTGRESNTIVAYSPDGIHLGWKRLLMQNKDYPAGLTRHVRDPKVWEQDGTFYMVQGARTSADTAQALLFSSKDGFQWEHINTFRTEQPFGYIWECPDLFEMDGQWFLLGCPQGVQKQQPGFENQYACGYFPLYGDFRGQCRLGEFVPFDYGFDFYAPQTFFDGTRRLLIGWMGMPDAAYTNPTVSYGWQHCLTVPRELTCVDGKLRMRPVKELESLRIGAQELCFSGQQSIEVPRACEILLRWSGDLRLELSGAALKAEHGMLTLTLEAGGCGRGTRSVPIENLKTLRLLADTSALEIFADDGRAVLTTRWYPDGERRTLALQGEGRAVVYGLRPMRIEHPPLQ